LIRPARSTLEIANVFVASEQNFKSTSTACVLAGGYSVHAETAIKSYERERLEKLVRYMARPAISDERVIIEGPESIRIKLKSAWADGSCGVHRVATDIDTGCRRNLNIILCGPVSVSVHKAAHRLAGIRAKPTALTSP
jgi:hypothetical protein